MPLKLPVEPVAKLAHCPGFAFSPDGRHLVGLPGSSPARLFDVRTWKQKHDFKKSSDLGAAAFSADGKIVALAEMYQYLGTYRVASGELICKWRINKEWNQVSGVIMSPSTPEVVYACWENLLRVFDVKSGNPTRQLRATEKDATITSVSLSPKGDELAAAWSARTVDGQKWESAVTVWNWPDGTIKRKLTLFGTPRKGATDKHEIKEICYLPNGKEIAAISRVGAVGLFDAHTGKRKVQIRKDMENSYGYLTVSPSGKQLAVSDKGRLLVWSLPKGKLLREMQIDESSSHDVGFSMDGKFLAVSKGQTLIWQLDDLLRQ